MKRILVYYPSNKRSVAIESELIEFRKLGHEVLFLTTCEKGDIHDKLNEEGFKTFTKVLKNSNPISYYLNNILFLIRFCRSNKIDLVFSNLQHVNFIAVLAQFFMKSKVIAFRHHFKFNKGHFGIPLQVNKTEILFDKVINRLAKKIVVPSSGVYNGMLQHEKVKKEKLSIIPYLYDFSQYGVPDKVTVEKIKEQYPAKLRLIMIARLIPFKRHILIFPVIKKLIEKGHDIKLLVFDEGPESKLLNDYIQQNKLENHIFMLGFRRNLLDYMKACDLIIHPSITEASNNVIKEIGLQEKVVAVCKNVGDFDDYIEHGKNGYFMDITQPEKDAEIIIETIYKNPELAKTLGKNLKSTIHSTFGDSELVINMYTELIND